jgi:hypothetical protein
MLEQYGIQQIYSIAIKALSPVKIGNKQYGTNEVILYLKDVEAGKLVEDTSIREAEGGQDNPRLIQWLTHSNVNFLVSKGVLSKRELNFLLDSNIIQKDNILVSLREEHTASSTGIITLNKVPQPGIYCYDEQGDIIRGISRDGRQLSLGEGYANQEITVDYSYEIEKAHTYSIRKDFLSNIVVKAEIQFLLKDDNDGEEYTGILIIPTANVVGDINLIMGKKATPIVGDFAIQSVQSKTESRDKRSNYILKILDRDITVI